MQAGVYKIKNQINNKCYIGSAIDVQIRWTIHKSQLVNQCHHSIHLQRAWNKYGVDTFIFEILEECDPKQCLVREQYYLNTLLFASHDDKRFYELGYNICRQADNVMGGRKHSQISKMKMSKAHKGKKLSEQTKQKMKRRFQNSEDHPMYGKTHTDEAKQKISEAGRGRITSIKCRKALSNANRGEGSFHSKLTERSVKEIKKMIADGKGTSMIARKYKISPSSICDIKAGRTWTYIE